MFCGFSTIYLKCIVVDWDYSCGSSLVPEDHELDNILFVCEKISCESPIELAYYSSHKNYPSISYWCGYDQEFQTIWHQNINLYFLCVMYVRVKERIFLHGLKLKQILMLKVEKEKEMLISQFVQQI